jgi:hypothetical protein
MIITGCAGIGKYNYYSPSSDKGDLKRITPVHVYAHYMKKDGPPERIEYHFQDIDFEMYVWDNYYDTYFFGPCFTSSVCLPIIPVFPISLLIPHKMASDGLELSLTITRLERDLNIDLDNIKIITHDLKKELLPQKMNDKDIQDRQFILVPRDKGYHYLHLTFPTVEKMESIEVVIDGFFIDNQKIEIPMITFNLKSEMVNIGD